MRAGAGRAFRIAGTMLLALLALLAALLTGHLRAPLPWMIGPLLAVALVGVSGVRVETPAPFRNAGQ